MAFIVQDSDRQRLKLQMKFVSRLEIINANKPNIENSLTKVSLNKKE